MVSNSLVTVLFKAQIGLVHKPLKFFFVLLFTVAKLFSWNNLVLALTAMKPD